MQSQGGSSVGARPAAWVAQLTAAFVVALPERPGGGPRRDHTQVPVTAEDEQWPLFGPAGPGSEHCGPHHCQF